MVEFLLISHVLAGTVALISAFFAIVTEKGMKAHVLHGRIYSIAMAYVALGALVLSIIRPNPFLFAIALFSGFMVWTGYRTAKNRSGEATKLEIYSSYAGVVIVLLMLGYGGFLIAQGNLMGTVLFVFSVVIIGYLIEDFRSLKKGFAKGKKRIAKHLQRMLGGTIATITAVLVQQVAPRVADSTWLEVLIWLGPTIVITPLIFYWSNKTLKPVSN